MIVEVLSLALVSLGCAGVVVRLVEEIGEEGYVVAVTAVIGVIVVTAVAAVLAKTAPGSAFLVCLLSRLVGFERRVEE